ncbi:hypothetical protein ABB37_00954 [Leptomonas pyrrhocoris]|uniref:Conserved oligomeric Golgi complex subunit 7 n=1 Tax=Leptomonas pyrrhocoris TaxID=157538 RepID=A0A0N0VI64_LEPPY|nr:hypothetical protein ABB37_00954 [Leptomonas pyrrhocoris]KPA86921.1 hypothetical protein ABB37_00954 [Leptomonas pyrrhocoris]|eukprot:XP_015665360.1 hypothetical protein ABB37_00954 [Leptomonas pyrrhocoris]
MSLESSSARVEKSLFTSPPSLHHTPVAATAALTPATGVTGLPPECTAKVSSVITDDLRQLSRDDLDVRRWLNATLSRVLEAAKDTPITSGEARSSGSSNTGTSTAPRKSPQVEEPLVQLLLARVQTHHQELSASIEDLVSNTLVRLPRTTMELSRMSTEAGELTGQLKSIEDIVKPAVNAKSDAYVAQLHVRKASEMKLRKCMRLLEKAARVEESIRNIQYLVEHREANAGHQNKSDSSNNNNHGTLSSADLRNNGADAAGKASATTTKATRQRDLDEVAAIIRQARDDLKEITAVDDTFGEQYKAQLEQFEQYIEQALEEECVACLRTHQLERATRLITTLHSIGRADAVLRRYGEQAATQMVEQQAAKLRAVFDGGNDGVKSGRNAAAAVVAELLRDEIIPDDSVFLSQELTFLAHLVRGAAAAASAVEEGGTTPSAASTTAEGGTGKSDGSSTPLRTSPPPSAGTFAAKDGGGHDVSSPSAKGTSSSSSHALEDDARAVQVLEVLEVLLAKLYVPVQTVLQTLLTERPDTTNKDFVACFTATQQIKISVNAASLPASSAAGATAKDPLEKLAREVTHRAVALFASLFQEEKMLTRYADRVCTPVRVYCAQPLTKILVSSPSSSSGPASSYDDSLAQVLTQAAQEVLVYVPEKISARCTAAWHAELSNTLAQQLQPTPGASQHVLLQHLYLYKERIKPLLAKTQQAVEDWLSSGAMQERYPTSAGLLRADLQTRLWTPLKTEVEAAQRATQLGILHGITRPILAKVESYTALPCWGNHDNATRVGSPGAQGGAAAASAKQLGLPTQSQVAPSSAVRDMGEMLMELPLTLETLASTAVAESYRGAADSNGGVRRSAAATAVIAANDADAEEGVRVLIDEQAEVWLETVVGDVVRAFLDEKVLPLKIGPFTDAEQPGEGHVNTLNTEATAQLYAMALEQLTTDLDYLRNILSAVNEESQETVERVMSAIRALPSARLEAFTVGEATGLATCEAVDGEDARREKNETAVRPAKSA